jgi:hypothetical protein
MQMSRHFFAALILIAFPVTSLGMEKNQKLSSHAKNDQIFPLVAKQLITQSHTRCSALETIHALSLVNKSIRKSLHNNQQELTDKITQKIGYEDLVDGNGADLELSAVRKAIIREALEEETALKEQYGYTFLYKDSGVFKFCDLLASIENAEPVPTRNDHINNVLQAYNWSLKRYKYELSATLLGIFKKSVENLTDNSHLQKTFSDVIKPCLSGFSPRLIQLSLKTGKDLFGTQFMEIPGLRSHATTIDTFVDLYKQDDQVIAPLIARAVINDIKNVYRLENK